MISEVDREEESIADLKEVFKKSRFKDQEVADVEIEINLTRGLNTFVCKLDAVFKIGDRYEIVDWKTGTVPKDEESKKQMTLQLALYRFAYSELKKIPIEQIDVSFYFVSEDAELRPESVPSPQEIVGMWEELFA
jgi:DNA helicase-2/ATP-dependent DNA helicase PcrA